MTGTAFHGYNTQDNQTTLLGALLILSQRESVQDQISFLPRYFFRKKALGYLESSQVLDRIREKPRDNFRGCLDAKESQNVFCNCSAIGQTQTSLVCR